jgi:hypothetical protein
MAVQQARQKSFFAKYWWIFAGGGVLLLIALAAAAVLLYLFVLRGEAKVTGLELSADSVEYGKKIVATVTVGNDRVLDATFEGKLTVDGMEKDLDEVEVPPRESATVKYNLSGLKPGKHTVSIGELEKSFKVLKPAEFTVSGLAIDPAGDVLVGGTLTAAAKVKNSGEVEGTYLAKFAYDGAQMDPVSVKVGPGKEETVTVSVTVPANGAHEISLEGQKQPFTAYNPAYITPEGLKLAKALAKPGEKVALTVTLANSGDLSGSYPLEVMVNGKPAYTEQVTVDGGKQVDVPLEITEDKAGTYTIQVGDYSQTLRVAVITRPKNGTQLVKTNIGGNDRLVLKNQYDNDVVVTLTSVSNTGKALVSFYARAKSTVTIKVKKGTYYLFYSVGKNWDSATKQFIDDAKYSLFDDSFPFYGDYRGWEVEIGKQSGGNVTTSSVSESDFPK